MTQSTILDDSLLVESVICKLNFPDIFDYVIHRNIGDIGTEYFLEKALNFTQMTNTTTVHS